MGGIEFRDRINNKGKFHGILLIFRAFNTQSISFIAMQENQNPKDEVVARSATTSSFGFKQNLCEK
ncbi:hypothetical protein B9G53_13580 [Pseudanabaena sp. SR411]|nr:hypothetical protein B9G53_13580 [Pseudanabaena sp. SR411]